MATKQVVAKVCSVSVDNTCNGSVEGVIVYWTKINSKVRGHGTNPKAGKFQVIYMDRLLPGQYLCSSKLHLNPLDITMDGSRIATMYVLGGQVYRAALLFGRIATGAFARSAWELVNWLNYTLDKYCRTDETRDALARYWILQDPKRIFPTHCRYLTYQSYLLTGEPCIVVPKQQLLPDVIKDVLPLGFCRAIKPPRKEVQEEDPKLGTQLTNGHAAVESA